jgi:protein SCO1
VAILRSWLGTTAALLLVSSASIAASWHLTLGFRAWTSEDARRIQVVETPVFLPPIELVSSAGRRFVPWNPGERSQRVYLLDFVYTRCQTLCSVLGAQFFQLQQAITDADQHLALLTISFDPRHDTPAELKSYAARMKAGALWTIAVPLDEMSLRRLLREAGIVVIDDKMGGFAHNGATLVVTASGRLMRVFDYTDYRDALAFARSVAG